MAGGGAQSRAPCPSASCWPGPCLTPIAAWAGALPDLIMMTLHSWIGAASFLIYAGVAFAGGLLCWHNLPETKGRTLAEVQALLAPKHAQQQQGTELGQESGARVPADVELGFQGDSAADPARGAPSGGPWYLQLRAHCCWVLLPVWGAALKSADPAYLGRDSSSPGGHDMVRITAAEVEGSSSGSCFHCCRCSAWDTCFLVSHSLLLWDAGPLRSSA